MDQHQHFFEHDRVYLLESWVKISPTFFRYFIHIKGKDKNTLCKHGCTHSYCPLKESYGSIDCNEHLLFKPIGQKGILHDTLSFQCC